MILKIAGGVFATVVFLAWGAIRVYAAVTYNIAIENHISRAASSPNPTVAIEELDVAIKGAAERGLTSGNTGIIFTYPNNDLGFWYRRLVDSRQILAALPPNDSALEISNTMIRVHETLIGSDKNGQKIIEPNGISVFPHNVALAWMAWVSLLSACVFWLLVIVDD